jgi:hypothetical protein
MKMILEAVNLGLNLVDESSMDLYKLTGSVMTPFERELPDRKGL